MDLGLINHKLVNDEYAGREPFVEDLRLVFSNAVEFNRPASDSAPSLDLNLIWWRRWRRHETTVTPSTRRPESPRAARESRDGINQHRPPNKPSRSKN